jgi:hypothetical protein
VALTVGGCSGSREPGQAWGEKPAIVTISTQTEAVPGRVQWVAFQSGAGPWTRLQPSRPGTYLGACTSSDGKYGFAVVYDFGEAVWQTICQATVAELPEVRLDTGTIVGARAPPKWHTISGSLAGVPTGQFADIYVYVARESIPGGATAWSTDSAAEGVHDLLAVRYAVTGDPMHPTYVYDKVIVLRDINVTGDMTINLDFDSKQAYDLDTFPVSVSSAGGAWGLSGIMKTRNHTTWRWHFHGLSDTYYALPAALRDPGDRYRLSGLGGSVPASLWRDLYFAVPGPKDMTLPAPLGSAAISIAATTPYRRAAVNWTHYPRALYYEASILTSGWCDVILTPGWLGSAATYEYTMPDFGSVAGWHNAWGLPEHAAWWVTATTSNQGIGDTIGIPQGQTAPDNTDIGTAEIEGSF